MRCIFFAICLLLTNVPVVVGTSLAQRSDSGALNQQQAETKLSAAGITTSSTGGCTDKNNSKCTSLDGIRSTTIDGLVALKSSCHCGIIITGGTEVGHAESIYSHGNGYKVDIRKEACLNNYVEKEYMSIENRESDGYPQWKSKEGYIFCDEGNHWDVVFHSF